MLFCYHILFIIFLFHVEDEEMTDTSGGGSLNNSLKKTIDDSSSDVSSTGIAPSPQARPKIDPTSVQLRSTKDIKSAPVFWRCTLS